MDSVWMVRCPLLYLTHNLLYMFLLLLLASITKYLVFGLFAGLKKKNAAHQAPGGVGQPLSKETVLDECAKAAIAAAALKFSELKSQHTISMAGVKAAAILWEKKKGRPSLVYVVHAVSLVKYIFAFNYFVL